MFRYAALESSKQVPVTYEWLRLEDRTSHSGELPSGGKSFTVNFAKPGNYNLTLRDKDGLILAGLSHAVSGKGSTAHTGTVDNRRQRCADTGVHFVVSAEKHHL